jgi:transposase-like protein
MPRSKKQSSEAAVRDIRRKTRRRFSAEEKIRIVLDGLRGELSVARPIEHWARQFEARRIRRLREPVGDS